jgi:hypothetical protein
MGSLFHSSSFARVVPDIPDPVIPTPSEVPEFVVKINYHVAAAELNLSAAVSLVLYCECSRANGKSIIIKPAVPVEFTLSARADRESQAPTMGPIGPSAWP